MYPHTQSMANPLPGALADGLDLTRAQSETVRFFQNHARENGASLSVSQHDGVTYLVETASAEWDNEVTTWTLRADGVAEIH